MAKKAATPATTQPQELFGLFPDWRIKKPVRNARDEELEASSEACEWWAWRGAMALMVGLIAEVILAWWDPPHETILGRWGNVFGTVLVAIGVGVEVQFGKMAAARQGELTRRSKQRLGEAVDKASKLDAENLQLRTHLAPRTLNKEQFEAFQKLRGKVDSLLLLIVANAESHLLAAQLAVALQNAGITVRSRPAPPDFWAEGVWVIDLKAYNNQDGSPTAGEPLIGVLDRVPERGVGRRGFRRSPALAGLVSLPRWSG